MVTKNDKTLTISKEQQRLISLELAYFALVKTLHDDAGLDIEKLINNTKTFNLGGVRLTEKNLILGGLQSLQANLTKKK
ncbi:MAG: hypothetical protein ACK5LE_09525 [Alphaproteobacteria bacterium]